MTAAEYEEYASRYNQLSIKSAVANLESSIFVMSKCNKLM